ncbi:hypothetical protein [Streptomyces sp. NPDC058867]
MQEIVVAVIGAVGAVIAAVSAAIVTDKLSNRRRSQQPEENGSEE